MALDVTVGGANAQAYGDLTAFAAYCDTVGYSLVSYVTEKQEEASVRGCAWLDAFYQRRWPGYRKNGRSQARAWPRTGATDAEGETIDENTIPPEVLRASFEATYYELVKPYSLSPMMIPNQQKVLTRADDLAWSVIRRSSRREDNLPVLTVVDRLLSTIVPINNYRYYKTV